MHEFRMKKIRKDAIKKKRINGQRARMPSGCPLEYLKRYRFNNKKIYQTTIKILQNDHPL